MKPRSSVGGGDRLSGGEPWFPCRITGSLSTGTTGKDVITYTAVEVWIDGQGNTIDKVTGRVLGTTNPGAPLDSTTTFVTGELALARPAAGAGGLLWELATYSGGDRFGFWAEITGSSGTPLGYSWKRKVMTGPGVWADATEPTPLTGTADAYRAPSNVDPPVIPTGQVVELRLSRTSPGEYEIHAVGGIQTETFNIWRYSCSGGSLIETEYTVTVKGRDLDISVA